MLHITPISTRDVTNYLSATEPYSTHIWPIFVINRVQWRNCMRTLSSPASNPKNMVTYMIPLLFDCILDIHRCMYQTNPFTCLDNVSQAGKNVWYFLHFSSLFSESKWGKPYYLEKMCDMPHIRSHKVALVFYMQNPQVSCIFVVFFVLCHVYSCVHMMICSVQCTMTSVWLCALLVCNRRRSSLAVVSLQRLEADPTSVIMDDHANICPFIVGTWKRTRN
jgi:hypothetical protein